MGGFTSVVEDVLRKAGAELGPAIKGVAERWMNRGATNVKKIAPSGAKLVEALHGFAEKESMYRGEFDAAREKVLKSVNKTPEVLKDYAKHFEGGTVPPPDLQPLVDFDKGAMLASHRKAQQAGIPVGPLIQDYFPHKWPENFFEGKNRDSAIAQLIAGGDAKNEAQAMKILDRLSGRAGPYSHNLRTPRRVGLKGYRTDIYTPSDVVHDTVKDIAFHETFGPKRELLDEMLSQIKREGGTPAYRLAEQYTDVFLHKRGANYHPYSKAETTLSTLSAIRYLGLTPLKHPSKILNNVWFSGRLAPVVKGIWKMVEDFGEAREFGIRSGAVPITVNSLRQTFDNDFGRGLRTLIPQLKVIDMEERFGRILSANVGRELAQDLVAEYAEGKSVTVKNKLAQLGIDAEQAVKRGLGEQDLLLAAKRTSDITQFQYNVENLPLAWRDHPLSRLLTQYKPFGYMQSVLLRDEVLKPAMTYIRTGGKDGALAPLVYFSLLFPTFGEVVADLSNLALRGDLKDRPEGKFWLDRAVDNVSYVGGIGIISDLIHAFTSRYGADRLIPPVLAEIKSVAEAASSKHPLKELAKQIPAVGPRISREMKPKTQRAKKGSLQRGVLTKGLYGLFGEKP